MIKTLLTIYLIVGAVNVVAVLVGLFALTNKVKREMKIVSYKFNKRPIIEVVWDLTKTTITFITPVIRLFTLYVLLFAEDLATEKIGEVIEEADVIVYTEEETKRREQNEKWLHRNDYDNDFEEDEDYYEEEEKDA